MHRQAIISDIHGNMPALEAVLADIATQNVNEIVCLGDICGYGPQPIECINRVRECASWTLLGNHDEAVFIEPIGFGANAYDAIVWQRKLLDPRHGAPDTPEVEERLNWLKSLQPQRREGNVLYVHASPRDPLYEYVLKDDYDAASGGPTAEAKTNFEIIDWLAFCGHSHRPGVVSEDFHWSLPEELTDGRFVLRPGYKTLVNIGSVGQPRDNHPESCYVIFDAPILPSSPPRTPAAPCAPAQPAAEANTMILSKSAHDKHQSGLHESPISSEKDVATRIIPAIKAPAPHAEQRAEHVPAHGDEETRSDADPVLQEARKTVLLRMPKVTFRRVAYDVAEASKRFFAVPELPKFNGVRLARGL